MTTILLALSLLAGPTTASHAPHTADAVQVHHGKGWIQAEDGSWVRPSFYYRRGAK